MAKMKAATYFESNGGHSLKVWTNEDNAISLKKIEGISSVMWEPDLHYFVVHIDPRYNMNELSREILALK